MGLKRTWLTEMARLMTPVFLHCGECRLPCTPSGRRILRYPDFDPAKVCEFQVRFRGRANG